MVDEVCALINSDENGRIKHPDKMRVFMEEIETDYLPFIENDPVAMAEFAIRLSFYHLALDEYDDCMRFYFLYDYKALPTKHFAPWLREQYLMCSWAVRILCFYNVLSDNEHFLSGEADDIRQWMKTWKDSNGREVSFLLAQYLGLSKVVLSTVVWKEKGDKTDSFHSWIKNATDDSFQLEVDLTYSRFKDDNDSKKLFFNQGMIKILDMEYKLGHPIELNKSYFLKSIAYNGGKFNGVIYNDVFEYHPEREDAEGLSSRLYKLVSGLVDERYPACPRIEDIHKESEDLLHGVKPLVIRIPLYQRVG